MNTEIWTDMVIKHRVNFESFFQTDKQPAHKKSHTHPSHISHSRDIHINNRKDNILRQRRQDKTRQDIHSIQPTLL